MAKNILMLKELKFRQEIIEKVMSSGITSTRELIKMADAISKSVSVTKSDLS